MAQASRVVHAALPSQQAGQSLQELEWWINRYGHSAVGAAYGGMNLHNVYANGQQVAGLDEAGKLDVLSRLTAFSNSDAGRTQVTVQAGEKLRDIAQRVYGNANLWYVIAEANALSETDTLAAGITLTVPEVKTSSNDSSTFKPYNPSEITGPTSPGLPYIQSPDNGCNGVMMVLMAVVAIVVMVYAPMLAPAMSQAFGGAVIGGVGAFAGSTVGGAMAASFVVASGASAVAQGVGSAMGATSFSWRQVATDGAMAALTVGLGQSNLVGDIASKFGGSKFALGAVSSLATNLGSQAIRRVTGTETHFSWRSLAASAVSGGIAAGVTPSLVGGIESVNTRRLIGGMVGGIFSMHTRRAFGFDDPINYADIAADAFGNMLASMIAERGDVNSTSSAGRPTSMGHSSGHISDLRIPGTIRGPVLDDGYNQSQATSTARVVDLETVSVSPEPSDYLFYLQGMQWFSLFNSMTSFQSPSRAIPQVDHWSSPSRRLSAAEMYGDVRRSNQINFLAGDRTSRSAVQVGPASKQVASTPSQTANIALVQRESISIGPSDPIAEQSYSWAWDMMSARTGLPNLPRIGSELAENLAEMQVGFNHFMNQPAVVRTVGAVGLVGSTVETAGAGFFAATTSPTGVGLVGFGAVALMGIDGMQSNARQVWTGQYVTPFGAQAIEATGVMSSTAAGWTYAGANVVAGVGVNAASAVTAEARLAASAGRVTNVPDTYELATQSVQVGKYARRTDINFRSASEVNATFPEGYASPYKPGTRVTEFTTTVDDIYVRAHGESNMARSWMMKREAIEGMSAREIKAKYALPELPTRISEVHVPAGTRIRTGVVNPVLGGIGNATQYELLQRLPVTAFRNTVGIW